MLPRKETLRCLLVTVSYPPINGTVWTYININRGSNQKMDSDSSLWFACLALWREALEAGAPITITALFRAIQLLAFLDYFASLLTLVLLRLQVFQTSTYNVSPSSLESPLNIKSGNTSTSPFFSHFLNQVPEITLLFRATLYIQYLNLLQDFSLHLHSHMVHMMIRIIVHHSILEHQHQVPLELCHGANPSLRQIPFQGR